MSLPKYSDNLSFSTLELVQELSKIEFEVFDLHFKKSTRQTFKHHELKHKKRRLAQLRTLLQIRLEDIQDDELDVLIENLN